MSTTSTAGTYANLTLERHGAVAVVTVSRPEKLNALTYDSYREFEALTRELPRNPDVRVLVVRGDGRAFCADILRDHGVAVVPGAFFGDPAGFRIGFGAPSRDFRQGWAIVRKEVAKRRWRIVPPAVAASSAT